MQQPGHQHQHYKVTAAWMKQWRTQKLILLIPADSKPPLSAVFPSTTEVEVCHVPGELQQNCSKKPQTAQPRPGKPEHCTSLDVQEHLTKKLSNMLQIWIKIPKFQGYSYHTAVLKSKMTSFFSWAGLPHPAPAWRNRQGSLPSSYLQTTQPSLPPQLSFKVFKHIHDLLWTGYSQKGKHNINYANFFLPGKTSLQVPCSSLWEATTLKYISP